MGNGRRLAFEAAAESSGGSDTPGEERPVILNDGGIPRMKPYDRLYVQFIYYLNVARDYFECHEVMEELWLEEGRDPLYKGLLQVAVGLYHYQNGNPNGSVKLLTGALQKLNGFADVELGLDLKRL